MCITYFDHINPPLPSPALSLIPFLNLVRLYSFNVFISLGSPYEETWYLSSYIWFISLNMISSFIHFPALFCSSLWLNNTLLYLSSYPSIIHLSIYLITFSVIHSSVGGHIRWFHSLAIVSSAVISMGVFPVYWVTLLYLCTWIVLQVIR
jgi:hypothetical protein